MAGDKTLEGSDTTGVILFGLLMGESTPLPPPPPPTQTAAVTNQTDVDLQVLCENRCYLILSIQRARETMMDGSTRCEQIVSPSCRSKACRVEDMLERLGAGKRGELCVDERSCAGIRQNNSTLPPLPSPSSFHPPSPRVPSGALHVLMGADHLLALAVVAAPGASDASSEDEDGADEDDEEQQRGEGGGRREADDDDDDKRRRRRSRVVTTSLRRALRSFVLGLQWGLGHSIGLAAVGLYELTRIA
jgi:hypothetical protein